MNYMKIDRTSISNGTGVRVVLWCAGCTQKCHGCFNPETWDFKAGQQFNETTKEHLFGLLSKPYIRGITFSGGHPLEPENCTDILNLILDIRTVFPQKDIWLYTGYKLTMDDFKFGIYEKRTILNLCDIIVDGPYIEEQRDFTLAFRGSNNQRLIDVKETIKQDKIVTIQN